MSTQTVGRIPEWTLGDRLRKAREDAGLSQVELALSIGVSRGTIGNAELDDRRPLPITLRAWADATGVPLEWLLTGTASPPNGPGLPRLDSNQKPPGLRFRTTLDMSRLAV